MAYVVIKRNGKKVNHPFVYTEKEVERLRSVGKENLTLVNVATHRITKVKKHKRRV